MTAFNGCKVFSATLWKHRAVLDEQVTHWLEKMRQQPGFKIVDIVVRQSSDDEYHALSIVIFYNAPPERQRDPR